MMFDHDDFNDDVDMFRKIFMGSVPVMVVTAITGILALTISGGIIAVLVLLIMKLSE